MNSRKNSLGGKNMKRFLILLSVLILAFLAAACGNNAEAQRMQKNGEQQTAMMMSEWID